MQPDLTISVISADNLAQLLPCLRSVFAGTQRITLEVFVVDNASQDDTAQAVMSEFPQVIVIRNSEQLGFSTNNNMILRQGTGRYMMLLNDDTLLLDGALDTLIGFADCQSDAGVIGSFLLNPDCTFQPSFSSLPNPWIEGFWSTAAWFPNLNSETQSPFVTQTVCGAALVIRRKTMEQVGLLDTAFDPIYAEETDWCRRVRDAGWQVYTQPQAKIIHYGGQTMDRAPLRKQLLLQGHKAYYFRKHHGKFSEYFFRTTLCVASLAKVVRYSFLSANSRNVERRRLHWYMAVHAFRM